MSIFTTDTIEQAGDRAIEQLYDKGPWPCPVCKQPGSLYRKSDCEEYDINVDTEKILGEKVCSWVCSHYKKDEKSQLEAAIPLNISK